MQYKIENRRLAITIADKGAELVSIYDKKNKREILWQADPAYWQRHAPILFPNVGKFNNNEYLYNEKKYTSMQHGFARDMDFNCTNRTESSITHQLTYTAETKENYPFDFVLQVAYILDNTQIRVKWKVLNMGDNDMYFTIGAHPAFNVPILKNTERSDYKLLFKDVKKLEYLYLDPITGTVDPDHINKLELTNGACNITDDMFDRDALFFDNGQIKWVAIGYPNGNPYVGISCEDFSNFGIWSKPKASFVCLEPWSGRCDNKDFDKDITEKPNIIKVTREGIYQKGYEIIVY